MSKVWVVMGNDYPDSVWTTEAAAEAHVAKKKAGEPPHIKYHSPRIYWRAYEFEVNGDTEQ